MCKSPKVHMVGWIVFKRDKLGCRHKGTVGNKTPTECARNQHAL